MALGAVDRTLNVDRRMTCLASGSSGRILQGWQGVAEGSTLTFEEKRVFFALETTT